MIANTIVWTCGFVAGYIISMMHRKSKLDNAYHAGWEGAMEFLKVYVMEGHITKDNLIEYLRIRERKEDWSDDQ